MIHFRHRRSAFGVCIVLVACASTACFGQTTKTAPISPIALTPGQKQWMDLLEPWLGAVEKRRAAAQATRARVSAAIDETLDGKQIAQFTEHATSGHSQYLRLRNQGQWQLWMRAKFIEAVCPLDVIDKKVETERKQLEKQLSDIDADFLISHELDVEVSNALGLSFHPRSDVRYDRIQKRIDAALSRIIPHVDRANRASVLKFGVDTAIGMAAERAVRLASKDEEGNVSSEAALLALGSGFLGGLASEQMLDELDETPLRLEEAVRRELIRLRREITALVVAPETIAEDAELLWQRDAGRHIYQMPAEGEFTVAVYRHNVSLRYAIANALKVEREWSDDVTTTAYRKRKGAK